MHRRFLLAVWLAVAVSAEAAAACPIERASYADRDSVARVQFFATKEAATVTNSFKMLLGENVMLDGIVQWTEEVRRPNGLLMHHCPEGDVTGAELDRCTVWQGVIYTADEKGNIELLPAEGAEAPKTLIFSDLGHALRTSEAFSAGGLSAEPWDVFSIKECR